jgi:serine/threonine protein kinase
MTDKDFFERFVYDSEKDILGSGGFGTVYKAYDKFEKKYVAIKISQVKDIFGKFTLLNEVELSKKIDHHTNVARYEFGLRVTQPFLIDYAVMDYYEDGNLDHVLKKKQGKLSDSERYDIIEGLLEGLKHLHTEGVIHRDIKLANILMHKTRNEQWRPKIADFGLSRLMEKQDNSVSNSAVGITIAYAAPEQIENRAIKKNVDLWAFGVILYRLMTGHLPFEAAKGADPTSSNLEISRKIILAELPAEMIRIPQPYQYMIQRCLTKDTSDRVQSADELLDILKGKIKPIVKEVAQEIATPAPVDVTIIQTPEPPVKQEPVEERDLHTEFIERSYPSVLSSVNSEKEEKIISEAHEISEKPTQNKQRLYLSIAGGIVALLAVFFMINRANKTDTPPAAKETTTVVVDSEDAYKKAMTEGSIPALEQFITTNPNDKNVEIVKESLKVLRTKSEGLINDTQLFIDDNKFEVAKGYYEQLKKINPNDPSVSKFEALLKNK